MLICNPINSSNIKPKFGGNQHKQYKLKKIVDEDKLDEFISSIIKKEKKTNNGIICRYKDFLTKKEMKNFSSDLKGAINSFVINDNLHIIKHGSENGTFIDIVKKFFK